MTRVLAFAASTPGDAAARLGADAIHLWRIPYALSQGRAPLLALLSAYLAIPASAVVLEEDPRGKPRLATSLAGSRLEFNWSHSGDFALVALARGCALGVDIERIGKNLRTLDIAQRFFDPAETQTLRLLHPEARDDAFITLWCAKEAVLKESGEGISFGLARLRFSHGEEGWSLAHTDPALDTPAHWHLQSFDPVPGYRGALAWRGGPRSIVMLRPLEAMHEV